MDTENRNAQPVELDDDLLDGVAGGAAPETPEDLEIKTHLNSAGLIKCRKCPTRLHRVGLERHEDGSMKITMRCMRCATIYHLTVTPTDYSWSDYHIEQVDIGPGRW